MSREAAMRTLVQVENANCSYCMNDVRDELLARPLVRGVRLSATAGCWEVEHDHDDPQALTELLQRSLHGWQVSDNGEIVEVVNNPTQSGECTVHTAGRGPATPIS
jgi:copper chaperone CopZ